jgi:hypothetical protein
MKGKPLPPKLVFHPPQGKRKGLDDGLLGKHGRDPLFLRLLDPSNVLVEFALQGLHSLLPPLGMWRHLIEEANPDIEKHASHKQFEGLAIRQIHNRTRR